MNESIESEKKIRYISLVRRDGGEPILGIPYRAMSVDPDLVASFVLAIIIFENRQLRTFTKEGYVVIIEEGDYVVGLLIVDKVEDDSPYREKLIEIIKGFEAEYETHLQNWKGDIRPFREYALQILGNFPYRQFELELVPSIVTKSEANPDYHSKIPWSVGETDEKIHTIIGYINGKRSMKEIMEASELDEDEAKAIFSMLDHYNWITLTKKLGPDTKLVKLTDPPMFLQGVYGEALVKLVELCDGNLTLSQIVEQLPYTLEVLRTLAKNLIDAGVLGYAK